MTSSKLKIITTSLMASILLIGCGSDSTNKTTDSTTQASEATTPQNVLDAIAGETFELNQDLTNTLSYMGNEERLAYDVYNHLFELYPEIKQLNNIATKSEIIHIQTVQKLVQKYISDYSQFTNTENELGYRDTAVEDMTAGTYDIKAIQDLYDFLIAKGASSARDALEVACMVEVTDIDDLDKFIILAKESNATDVELAFDFLLRGSYSHYWAFDSGLKSMGVSEGCCSLGVINGVNYCHNEYPQNENGGGQGEGKGKGKR